MTNSSRHTIAAPLVLFVLLALAIIPVQTNALITCSDGSISIFSWDKCPTGVQPRDIRATQLAGTALVPYVYVPNWISEGLAGPTARALVPLTRVAPVGILGAALASPIIVPAIIIGGTAATAIHYGAPLIPSRISDKHEAAQSTCATIGYNSSNGLDTCTANVESQLNAGVDPLNITIEAVRGSSPTQTTGSFESGLSASPPSLNPASVSGQTVPQSLLFNATPAPTSFEAGSSARFPLPPASAQPPKAVVAPASKKAVQLSGGTSETASIPGGSEFECAEMYPDAYGSYLVCLQNGNAQSGPSATGGTSQTDFMTNCQASGESEYSCGLKLKFQSAGSADQPQSTTPASQIQITDSQNRFCMGSASGRTGIDTTVYNDCVQWVKDNPDAIIDNSNSTDGGGTGSAPYRADDSAFTGYTPGPAPAPVRATEFVNGGIYSNGRLIEMRDPNGPEANLAPTFVVPDWVPFSGWMNRSLFRIPESALSAPAQSGPVQQSQRNQYGSDYRFTIPNASAPTVQTTGPVRQDVSIQDSQVSENQPDVSCHTGIFSFLNGRTNNCGSENAAPESSGPVQQYQPFNPNIEYPGNEYYGAPIDANIDSDKDDVLNVEDYVNEYYRLNPPVEPETTTNDDYLWWQSPYIQRVTDPAGNDVDWTEFYGGEEFLYTAPTRQFSQAETSNPLANQSLAASVFSALIPLITDTRN